MDISRKECNEKENVMVAADEKHPVICVEHIRDTELNIDTHETSYIRMKTVN